MQNSPTAAIYPSDRKSAIWAQTRTRTVNQDNGRRPTHSLTHSPQATLTHTGALSLWLSVRRTPTDQQRQQEMKTGGVRLEISISKSLLFMEGWPDTQRNTHTRTSKAAVKRIQKKIYCNAASDSHPPGLAVSTEVTLFLPDVWFHRLAISWYTAKLSVCLLAG